MENSRFERQVRDHYMGNGQTADLNKKKKAKKLAIVKSSVGASTPDKIKLDGVTMKKKKGLGKAVSKIAKSKTFKAIKKVAPIAGGLALAGGAGLGLKALSKSGKVVKLAKAGKKTKLGKKLTGSVIKSAKKKIALKKGKIAAGQRLTPQDEKEIDASESIVSLSTLIPLMPTMGSALQRKGITPPKSVEARAQLFHEKIVVPNSFERSLNFDTLQRSANLTDDMVTSIVDFVKNLKDTAENPEESDAKLSPFLQSIAEDTIQITKKLSGEDKEEKEGGETSKLLEGNNKYFLIGGALLLGYFATR